MKNSDLIGRIVGFNIQPDGALTPFFLQCIMFSLLVVTSPFALSFTPYPRIFTDGVWNAPFQSDPIFPIRAGFIIGGMLAAILSAYLLVWEIAKGKENASVRVLQASMALCSLQIGWVAFPYWVNGIFQAYAGNRRVADFDPKGLMPGIWMGEFWRLSASLIYLETFAAVIALFVFNIDTTLSKRKWKQGVATIICLAMTFAIFYLTPNYLEWLAD